MAAADVLQECIECTVTGILETRVDSGFSNQISRVFTHLKFRIRLDYSIGLLLGHLRTLADEVSDRLPCELFALWGRILHEELKRERCCAGIAHLLGMLLEEG